jgi:hypothetical protein
MKRVTFASLGIECYIRERGGVLTITIRDILRG